MRPLGAAWIVVLVGGLWLEAAAAAAAFGLAAIVFGLGECFQGPVQGALVPTSPPAPPRPLHGRLDDLVGHRLHRRPAVGGFVLQAEPLALWPLAAAVCLLAGAGAIALERDDPRELRLTAGPACFRRTSLSRWPGFRAVLEGPEALRWNRLGLGAYAARAEQAVEAEDLVLDREHLDVREAGLGA